MQKEIFLTDRYVAYEYNKISAVDKMFNTTEYRRLEVICLL